MKCRKCNEDLVEGDFTRAEPVSAGSQHYVFYHDSCWRQVKEQRQKQDRAFPDYPDRSKPLPFTTSDTD